MTGPAANRWWWPWPVTSAALLDAGRLVGAKLRGVVSPVLGGGLGGAPGATGGVR
jgi:hypothetical protein